MLCEQAMSREAFQTTSHTSKLEHQRQLTRDAYFLQYKHGVALQPSKCAEAYLWGIQHST